jgi:hypothetical protein
MSRYLSIIDSDLRRFLFKVVFLAAPSLAILVGTNWVVDPVKVIRPAVLEQQDIIAMRRGKNIDKYEGRDEGLTQVLYAQSQTTPVDVLVLGSSRARQIRASSFPGKTFYNAALNDCAFVELMGSYDLWVRRGLVKQTLIINIDPWTCNATQISWRHLLPYAQEFTNSAGLPLPADLPDKSKVRRDIPAAKLIFLFSPSYFHTAIAAVRHGKATFFDIKLTDQEYGEVHIKRTDGSVSMTNKEMNKSTDTTQQESIAWARANDETAFLTNQFSEEKYIEKLVAAACASKLHVVLLVEPLHPELYKVLPPDCRQVVDGMEQRARTWSQKYGAEMLGSFDADKVGWTAADFSDAVHPRPKAVAQLLSRM